MRDTLPELVRSRSFLPEYRRRSILLGRPVRVLPVGQEPYEATAESIDEEAALVVDCQGRKIRLQKMCIRDRLCAVYLARFCPPRVYKYLKPAVDLLAGIPSIV